MASPYIHTQLNTNVMLLPHQMNNNIYLNLKSNLESKLLGKCFTSFGVVMKIIEIVSYKRGIIEAENAQCSALFDICFSCRLCVPLINSNIICVIESINKTFLVANNGPIRVIITNDRINMNKFFIDNNNNIKYKDKNASTLINKNDYVKIRLETVKFYHGDNMIKTIGFLEDIANEQEKEIYFKDLHYSDNSNVTFVEYKKHVADK